MARIPASHLSGTLLVKEYMVRGLKVLSQKVRFKQETYGGHPFYDIPILDLKTLPQLHPTVVTHRLHGKSCRRSAGSKPVFFSINWSTAIPAGDVSNMNPV